MTVEQATSLRASFRKAGVEYKVVKNTLVRQALKDTAFGKQLNDVLVGMTGIAWCYEDPSPPTSGPPAAGWATST